MEQSDCLLKIVFIQIAPNKKEYESGSARSGNPNSDSEISVVADSRRNECILTINSVKKSDSGFWECVVTEDRKSVGKFAFLRTFAADGGAPLKLLLDPDSTRWQFYQSFWAKCKWAGIWPGGNFTNPVAQSTYLLAYSIWYTVKDAFQFHRKQNSKFYLCTKLELLTTVTPYTQFHTPKKAA